jgi:uncharacterized membrane protein YeaQ/YmgE (transglycosylase-associated protein family)
MGLLSWIILGLLVGIIARWFLPGKDPGGIIITILLGIGGAFVGGLISSYFGLGKFSGFTGPSLFFAVVGAAILLTIYRMVKK